MIFQSPSDHNAIHHSEELLKNHAEQEIKMVLDLSRLGKRSALSLALSLGGLCTLISPAPTAAQITVDNVIVHLGVAERPVHNVLVGNSSNQPSYVKVEIEAMKAPGQSDEFIPTQDLLVSPKTFSVEGNGQRTVRLLLKTPPTDRERVFRVSFIPQDKGFGGEEVRHSQDGVTTVIKVMTGVGMLVFADPAKPVEELRWERVGKSITLVNSGNVNVYLGDGESCSPDKNCSKLPSKRLYQAGKHEVTSAPENIVSFLVHSKGTGEYKRLTIAPNETSGVLR
ncbi:MAG: molecular chaperone [Proteobacteria bacterium]|nr:molecular chaperone [Pseudomonadota bacterium]